MARKINFQINISNRIFYTLIAIGILIVGAWFVIAYTSVPNPGHGADTIKVTTTSGEKTLQQAINDGDFGGGSGGSLNCVTRSAANSISCQAGEILTGGSCNYGVGGQYFAGEYYSANTVICTNGDTAYAKCCTGSIVTLMDDDWYNTGGGSPTIDGTVYRTGNAVIGTSSLSAGLKLDVEGYVGADKYCDKNGNNCKTVLELVSGGASLSCTTRTCSIPEGGPCTVSCQAGEQATGGSSSSSALTNYPSGNGWYCPSGGPGICYARCCTFA